jgi:hypothetical protein
MPTYSNIQAVPLALQVFLATDSYDHNPDPFTISATSVIKPLRQLILGSRINQEDSAVDLSQMVAARMGTAIHDGIERAWINNYKQALTTLNYPANVINRIVINKPIDEVTEEDIPIYLEQRIEREIAGYKVSGKFDFVSEGMVQDFKSTGVYSAMTGNNNDKYILQGSIYRWLNPKLITKDEMAIHFIFTDWSAMRAKTENNYPQSRILQKIFPLKSLEETERYIVNKLNQIKQYQDADESAIPLCGDSDLWRSEPVFKYYKDPNKLVRSTKNFDNKQDAYLKLSQEGIGIVIEKPGVVTACRYCSGFSLCTQKDAFVASGELLL